MANKVYPQFMLARLNGASTVDLSAGGTDIRAILVDTGAYTYSDAHDMLDDVPSGARVAVSTALQNKTVAVVTTDDVRLDADDITITVGSSQPSVEAVIYYIHTGTESTSRLIAFKDTGVSGLPYTPPTGGGSVLLQISANGIFEWRN